MGGRSEERGDRERKGSKGRRERGRMKSRIV